MSRELVQYKNEFLQSLEHVTYANHCNKFFGFLEEINKVDKPSTIGILDVEHSVEYYSNLGKINTRSTMDIHLESIKAFYSYLQAKEYRKNIFNDIPDYDTFKNGLITRLHISEANEREYIAIPTLIELLRYFDESVGYDNNRLMMIKLFTKITLIAPAKRRVIANLKFSDFEDNYRILKINGVKIRVPNSLRKELISYIEQRGEVTNIDSLLFKHFYDFSYKDEVFNIPLAIALKAIGFDIPDDKKTYSVETIMNTAIYAMLSSNTNPMLIAKVNGVSVDRIGDKAVKYGFPIVDYDGLINSAIMNAEYYTFI